MVQGVNVVGVHPFSVHGRCWFISCMCKKNDPSQRICAVLDPRMQCCSPGVHLRRMPLEDAGYPRPKDAPLPKAAMRTVQLQLLQMQVLLLWHSQEVQSEEVQVLIRKLCVR
jgi:hypothetical protein